MTDEPDIMEFPLDFPLKIIGRENQDFQALIIELLEPHTGELNRATMKFQASSKGTFVSLTINFTATSRAQLDRIYQELSDHPEVLFSL